MTALFLGQTESCLQGNSRVSNRRALICFMRLHPQDTTKGPAFKTFTLGVKITWNWVGERAHPVYRAFLQLLSLTWVFLK